MSLVHKKTEQHPGMLVEKQQLPLITLKKDRSTLGNSRCALPLSLQLLNLSAPCII